MYTYNDLVAVGENALAKGEFCKKAVEQFMGTAEYRQARDGEAYYNKHNLTIEKFQKMLYTVSGRQVPDVFSANYKLKTLFFRRLITQQVQYVLGNGLILQEQGNKEKLGKDFDFRLQEIAKKALAGGKAFGFWNYDHMEVFGYADTPSSTGFCPIYSDETSELMAGIRYWYRIVADKKIFRATLYEVDGYTEFSQKEGKNMNVMQDKRGYKRTTVKTADVVESVVDENYTKLPIVILYGNDTHESELVGLRESIDAYDYIKSGLASDIDDTSGFYWILKNTGGMDDVDLATFVQRMKTVKASAVEGDECATAEAHTLDVPYQARQVMLEMLRKDIYEDFQALDVNTLSASAKTTQEIQSAYQAQDNKCADFEYLLIDFCQKIMELAGINDNPSFNWNRVVNQSEQTAMVLSAGNYLSEEMVIKKLPFLTPEEAEAEIGRRETEQLDRFTPVVEEVEEVEE